MSKTPIVVPVSEVRRSTARLITQISRTHQPLYITQYGYVTAVVLSREEYDAMCVLRDRGQKAINPSFTPDDTPFYMRPVEDIDDWED